MEAKKHNRREDNKKTPIDVNDMAPWDTGGFATKYFKDKGHQPGNGLGKNENGITSPVEATKKPKFIKFVKAKKNILIAGTSMIGGLNSAKMSRQHKIKVSAHGGANLEDMKLHLTALLRKQPEHLIIQAGTNDAVEKNTTSDTIFDGLVGLKEFAESKVEGIQVTIACPIIRTDNPVAHAKLVQVKNRLRREGLKTLDNDNITTEHLTKVGKHPGLHLSGKGTVELAKNYIDYIRNL